MGVRAMSKVFSFQNISRISRQSDTGELSPGSSSGGDEEHLELLQPVTWDLILAVFVACVGMIQCGFHTGVLNVPETVIRANVVPGDYVSNMWWSAIVSVCAIGALIGVTAGSYYNDKYGRKKCILGLNLFFMIGSIIQALAISPLMLFIGRLLIGVAGGIVTSVVPLYIGELSPAQYRGTFGCFTQFSMVIGIFVSNLLGKPLGGPETWRYLLGLGALPGILCFMLAPVLKESPYWLVAEGRIEDAKELLQSLMKGQVDDEILDFHLSILQECVPRHDDDDDYDDIDVLSQGNNLKKKSTMDVLLDPAVRYPLMVGIMLHICQQFSGINAVFYYSSSFFEKAHFSNPWLGSVMASGVNVIATAISIPLIDKAGRRALIMFSAIAMAMSAVLITAVLYLSDPLYFTPNAMLNNLSVIGILLYVVFFELGLGPVPWLMGAEIIPPSAAATGVMVMTFFNWSCNFIVGITFPIMQANLDKLSFVPFGTVCLLCFIFTARYVKETKGLNMDQIQEIYS